MSACGHSPLWIHISLPPAIPVWTSLSRGRSAAPLVIPEAAIAAEGHAGNCLSIFTANTDPSAAQGAVAFAYADSIVQKTNASAMATDLTPLQQKGGAWRLFTMFMGESLRKGSRMRYWWGAYSQGSIGIGRYAYHLAMESIVPSLFFVGLTGMLSDDDPDNEDLAVAVFNELAGPYPFISGVAGALQYNKPLTQSTVFTGVESLLKTGKNTYSVFDNPNSAEAWARLYKSTVDLAAYQAGVGNVRRLYETAAQGWEDMEMDRTKNPFRLFFRKPKD